MSLPVPWTTSRRTRRRPRGWSGRRWDGVLRRRSWRWRWPARWRWSCIGRRFGGGWGQITTELQALVKLRIKLGDFRISDDLTWSWSQPRGNVHSALCVPGDDVHVFGHLSQAAVIEFTVEAGLGQVQEHLAQGEA